MVSFELINRMFEEIDSQTKIPPRPDPKQTKAWCEYFTARVKVGQAKRLIVVQYFQ